MRIGVVSDTHGDLPGRFLEVLEGCDVVVHAGDVGSEKCYQRVKKLDGAVYMIRGNCDLGRWAAFLPGTLGFLVDGIMFYLIHNLADLPFPVPEADVIIFGHTHARTAYRRRGVLYLNPGSAGAPRVGAASIAVLDIGEAGKPESITYQFFT